MPHQDFFTECRPEDNKTKVSHLTMYRGDTLSFKLILSSSGSPINITGGNFWWTVKSDINDPDNKAVFKKELGNGITLPYPELGQVLITLEPADTLALKQEETKSYYWDLQFQDAEGLVQTLFIGKLTILLDVTQEKGYIVGSSGIIVTNSLQANPIIAGVNPVEDGDNDTVNEQQRIAVSGASSGTFTLTVEDPNNPGVFETTGPLNWNCTSVDIKAAIELISFIDSVTVSGGPLNINPITIEFDGPAVTLLNVSLMVMDTSLLA